MSWRLDGIFLYQKRSTFVSPKIHVHGCRVGRHRPNLHRCLKSYYYNYNYYYLLLLLVLLLLLLLLCHH